MGIPPTQFFNLNKSRQRAVYWRPLTDGGWVQTRPLPADPDSIRYYFSKGFRAVNPEEQEVEQLEDGVPCPLCSFRAKDAFGLQSHLRKHINKNKEEKA
jgi:hypothetical protein